MGEVENSRCLLITGTVVPNSNYVVHSNAEKRLQEYYDSLAYYSSLFPGDPIYFLENSSYDFSRNEDFKKLFAGSGIVLIKLPVSDKYQEGKGFQEFEMLDRAVDLLKNRHHLFIKITGRYFVRNIKQIAKYKTEEIMIDQHRRKRVAITNFFCSTFNFYDKHLKGAYLEANDGKGIMIEQVIYKKLKLQEENRDIKLFPVNVKIEGISGSYGVSIKRNRLKMRIRNVERKLLRLFGINEFLLEY